MPHVTLSARVVPSLLVILLAANYAYGATTQEAPVTTAQVASTPVLESKSPAPEPVPAPIVPAVSAAVLPAAPPAPDLAVQPTPAPATTTTSQAVATKESKPAASPVATSLSSVEEEIIALFKEFNDLTSTISWPTFSLKMADILNKDSRYALAANTFKDLSESTWSIKIIWKLSSLKKYLPTHIADLFKGYSLSNFRTILNKRLALANGK